MDENTIQDLKQFIASSVHQEVSDVRTDIKQLDDDIKHLDDKLSTKIDDLSGSVASAIETANETTDTQLKDYGQRISNLEHKIA